MYAFDEEVLEFFLANQTKMYDEEVATTLEEADEFLEECMAVVVNGISEVRDYFEEMDVFGMSDKELEEQAEVFKMPDGRYLLIES